jgi:hypothetical protein
MSSWLAIAKAVAPHVSTIVSAALPAFTKLKSDSEANQAALAHKQIAELQEAVTGNGTMIRELAEQLGTTIDALELAAEDAKRQLRRLYLLTFASSAAALLALAVALVALLGG